MTPPAGVRRLPITAPPVTGESLRSLIEKAANTHRVPAAAILAAAGIKPAGTVNRALVRLDNNAGPHALGLSALLGLTAATVDTLTLNGTQDPTVVGWAKHRAIHLGWGTGPSGRHCPRCLAENGGRWLLTWLSPWTLVCTRHSVFLTHRCTACAQEARGTDASTGQTSPSGTRCATCTADLTAAPAHQAPVASYAYLGQAYVNTLRRRDPTDTVKTPDGGQSLVTDQFQDLRLLARHVHALARPGDYDLTGSEATSWRAWTAHRDRPSTLTTGPAAIMYGPRNAKSQTETTSYAAAVGIAATVLTASDMSAAGRLLSPVLYGQFSDRGRSASYKRHSIKYAWTTEDAAQWLLDAVEVPV